jgi:hypothetical protein
MHAKSGRYSKSVRGLTAGLVGAGTLAAGVTVWRAWRNGAWSVGEGAAYQPWRSWPQTPGPLSLVQAGILAANAHNSQPWLFRIANDAIAIYADFNRHLGSFDPFRREMHLSLGCALENLTHAARAQGLEPLIEMPPGRLSLPPLQRMTEAAAIVRLTPTERAVTELFLAISRRHTHRGPYLSDHDIPEPFLTEMQNLVNETSPMRLFLFTGVDMEPLAKLIVSATEAILADRQMAADNARWFRFGWNAVQQHCDGLTLDANVVPPILNVAAKIFPPSNEKAHRQWLRDTAKVHVGTAPLLGMISVRDLYDRPTALYAGRLWQRLHLWLTVRGLVAQPLNQPVECVDREHQMNAPERTAQALARITGDSDWHPTFIFRAGYADRPARLSPRRSVEAAIVGPHAPIKKPLG